MTIREFRTMLQTTLLGFATFLVVALLFTGQATAQDVTPPTVTGAVATPTTIDITFSSQSVTLTVTATDDISGIRVPGPDTRIIWRSPSNQVVQCPFGLASGTQLDAVLQATCIFPQFSETGSWRVDTIIADNVGNFARDSFTGLLTVTGTVDVTPPTVTGAVATPDTISVVASGQFVTLTVTATDDISGIRIPGPDTRIIWRSPSNQVVQCPFGLASGTQLDAVLQATCFIPQFSETGSWVVNTIIADNVGNFARDSFTGLLTVDLAVLPNVAMTSVTSNLPLSNPHIPLQIRATLANTGPEDILSVDMTLFLDLNSNLLLDGGEASFSTVVTDLLINTSQQVVGTFTNPPSGSYLGVAVADPLNLLRESDESDNIGSTALVLPLPPDLTPVAPLSHASFPRRSLFNVDLIAEIGNIGESAASNVQVIIALSADGGVTFTRQGGPSTVRTIGPGETQFVTKTLRNISPGDYVVEVTVDPNNTISEGDDETNNVSTFDLTVP